MGPVKSKRHVVMEYIEHIEIDKFIESSSLQLIRSMTVQSLFMIADLMLNYNIVHNDINSGNILIRKTTRKENRFTIEGKTYRVKTHGYMPMLVDFGMSRIDMDIQAKRVIEEMSMVTNIVYNYMKDKYSVQKNVLFDFLFKEQNNYTVQEYIKSTRAILKG
jgi:predicted unusual protein kinase regulating ubiquinone biosynthesis (AarF/ABC1/UbiB family)